jgi:hypothetical protein
MRSLKHLIPFLSGDELLELVLKIDESSDDSFEGVTIYELLPFLNKENVRKAFYDRIEKGKNVDIFAPFLDSEDCDELCAQAIKNGEGYARFFPFISGKFTQKLISLIEKEEMPKDFKYVELLPFLSHEGVDELFFWARKNGKGLVVFYPFLSKSSLHNFYEELVEKGDYDSPELNSLYPFLSDEDIKDLFSRYVKSKTKTN